MAKEAMKLVANNKKAYHDYFIEEKYEAGLELHGTEVKSLRLGKCSIKEGYVQIDNGEAFICGMNISPYEKGNIFNKDPLRVRKLLLHKVEIRKLAGKIGLRVADKPDSQDICFVPDGDYAAYIGENVSDAARERISPGNFVLSDGTVVGRHKGIIHYTVGQRKGLGLSLGHPVFVLKIRPETNEVVVGSHEEALSKQVRANKVNFMSVNDLMEKKRVWAKIRYNHKGAWCTAEKIGEDEILCVFEEPQRAVTPGQALVLYDGDYVLGGGTILSPDTL